MNKSIGLPFKADLVPKVLDGSKSQTRRLPGMHNCRLLHGDKDVTGKMRGLDRRHVKRVINLEEPIYFMVFHPADNCWYELVPRHEPGDIAWMRENHRFVEHNDGRDFTQYLADGVECQIPNIREYCDYTVGRYNRNRPSIHMPHWACRKEMVLTGVRIELIQDISEEDAIAEGIDRVGGAASCNPWRNYLRGEPGEMDMHCSCPRRSFQTLWDSINASRNWAWKLNKPIVLFDWSPE